MNVLHRFTRKTLLENKTRTIVTIIGIILSVSLITAVTTLFSSLQTFLIDTVVMEDGKWHGLVTDVSSDQLQQVKSSNEVQAYGTIQTVGYAALEDGQNEYKPYLYVAGIDSGFQELMPITITSGRMPENEKEILLPEHLALDGGIEYQLGDILDLDLGSRTNAAGESLNQSTSYTSGEEAEILTPKIHKSYVVVGFYERPSFENFEAPGYTALTYAGEKTSEEMTLYLQMKDPKQIFDFTKSHFQKNGIQYHYNLLRYIGASDEQSFNTVVFSMAGILIAIVMMASILLIYNAFSISVSERTQQFGLLSSIGATKRQIKQSVLYEAFLLSIIGIPLGVLTGIVGIGITLKLTADLFATSFFGMSKATMHLSVSAASIFIAIIIGMITVLLSAYWPAKRAVHYSPIDAIRQNADVKIKSGQVKTSKLTYKLFGLEGMLAKKNFKRNKKKYRATVISLFVSIVLFVSASSFCAYLRQSVGAVIQDVEYDIVYSYTPDTTEKISLDTLYQELFGVDGVTKGSYFSSTNREIQIPMDAVTEDFLSFYQEHLYDQENGNSENQTLTMSAKILFVNDQMYETYLKENGYDATIYMDAQNPTAIAISHLRLYLPDEEKYYTFQVLKDQNLSLDLTFIKEIPGYHLVGDGVSEDGSSVYSYQKKDGSGDSLDLTKEQATEKKTIRIGAVSDEKLFGMDNYYGEQICILYPYRAMTSMIGESYAQELMSEMIFQSNNHKETYAQQVKVLEDHTLSEGRLYDITESVETNRALLTIVNVFAYGFIILISLIASANVFNTISTNLHLRKREFSILKSVGMSEKEINRMMRYECILYGLKGLLFGIPVSVFITFLIYRSIARGLEQAFFVPISSLLIAIVSVFAVVFATMLYGRSKLKKENIIDVLKSESI